MKPLILFIEDDADGARQIKDFLDMNNYEVVLANNGKKGLELLSKLEPIPDIIISDIIMPEMDGYDFYMKVSQNSVWSRIPFVFLSAKSKPEDVRFGKILGADDYITKPFDLKDLLITIESKIKESRYNILSSDIIDGKQIKLWKTNDPPQLNIEKINFLYIFYMNWKDDTGPTIIDYYPKNMIQSLNLEEIVSQLYYALIKVYDYDKILKSTKYIFRIGIDLIDVYALIDKIGTEEILNGKKGIGTHMLSAIAPNFHYLQSERVKDVISHLANEVRETKDWDIKEQWEKLFKVYQEYS